MVHHEYASTVETMGRSKRIRTIWIQIQAPWIGNPTYDELGTLEPGSIHNGARWIQATKNGRVLVAPLTAESATYLKIKDFALTKHTLVQGNAKGIEALAMMHIEEVAINGLPKMNHEATTIKKIQETVVSELSKDLIDKLLRLHRTLMAEDEAEKDMRSQWLVTFGIKEEQPTMSDLKNAHVTMQKLWFDENCTMLHTDCMAISARIRIGNKEFPEAEHGEQVI